MWGVTPHPKDQTTMKRKHPFLFFTCVASLLAGVAQVLTAETQALATPGPARSDDLGGKERFAAYVSTDKPIYRGGERLYGRCVILAADSHVPLAQQPHLFFTITGPKGDRVASGGAAVDSSVAGLSWDVPAGQAGGEYLLTVTCPQLGLAPAVRKFDIRDFRAPRLKTQIVFLRDGYGPGDTVNATLAVTRAEGGVPEHAKVRISARVDGVEIHTATGTVDERGHCTAVLKLPAKIDRGEGSVAFTVEDGGAVETASKTIPILLQTIDLALYPEGGDLVAGLPCRVYIEGRTPAGKPADMSGVIEDAAGAQVAAFRTEHEGRGRFVITPEKGVAYRLRIIEPAGITRTWPLPAVRDVGTVIRALADVYPRGEPIALRVLTTEPGPLTVTLRKFENELAAFKVRGADKAGEDAIATVAFTPPAGVDGVLMATVWNSKNEPLAERLVFREPAHAIQVRIAASRPRYIPGAPASITVTTTDEHGEPQAAVVGVTVTDDSVLEMIEKREQAPRLPVMVYLESDVRELADAHVYLDSSNPKAPLALDLLLGTQGWRRFALINLARFLETNGDAGRRALAVRSAPPEHAAHLGISNHRVDGLGGLRNVLPASPVRARSTPAAVAAPVAAVADEDGKRQAGQPRPSIQGGLKAKEEAVGERRKRINGIAADAEMREAIEMRAEVLATVREYAHPARPGRQANERVDFTETLFWNAGVKTDAKTGQATFAFALNDAVSSFRVNADAFMAGAVGSGTGLVESVQPFYVEPKLPLEVTMGDRILLPLGLVNGTPDALDGAALKLTAAKGITTAGIAPFDLKADGRVRRIVEVAVGDVAGEGDFVVDASAGTYADHVVRRLRVVPRGFPVTQARGGMLSPDSALSFTISIPANRVPGSIRSDIAIYPTPMANLTKALERLLQEPSGCFEQTSSTTYPVVMVQQYFASHQGVDPQLADRGKDLLKKGYERLTSFECKQKGYEWFGQDPGHETLTAYGLLEFSDMARVYTVDSGMLQRTRQWLLAARDGKGGFRRERRALHTWIEDKDCSNAYITWALLMAGEPAASLRAEVDTVKAAAKKSENSYVIAIGANVALADKDAESARALLARLATRQAQDGFVGGGTATIVGSGGIALQVETTAYTLLAWLQDKAYVGNVERSLKWLAGVCEGGRYGSTQATVLALRAIIAYDQTRSTPKAPGGILLTVDGRQTGSEVKIGPETTGAIRLTDIAELLEPGEHMIVVRMTGGSEMPCSLTVQYSNDKPDSSDLCKVGITVALASDRVAEGKLTEAEVTIVNRAEDEIIPTPVAIIGLPGGLEVRHDQLKELVKSGKIAAYEVLGRQVVLYWRSLKAQEQVRLPLSLVAAIPGTYTGPSSRAYLYYTDEFKTWAAPLRVTITPAGD
jgi:uncharacterized protein YfaS (alpha-2-macroglobulin family)